MIDASNARDLRQVGYYYVTGTDPETNPSSLSWDTAWRGNLVYLFDMDRGIEVLRLKGGAHAAAKLATVREPRRGPDRLAKYLSPAAHARLARLPAVRAEQSLLRARGAARRRDERRARSSSIADEAGLRAVERALDGGDDVAVELAPGAAAQLLARGLERQRGRGRGGRRSSPRRRPRPRGCAPRAGSPRPPARAGSRRRRRARGGAAPRRRCRAGWRARGSAAELGVALDLGPLAVVERAGLVQDRVGDAELADVVEDAGGAHALDRRSAAKPSSRAICSA